MRLTRAKIGVFGAVAVIAATSLVGAAGGSPGSTGPARIGAVVPPIGTPKAPNGNLDYHGGPVMRTNKTYAIYWIPAGYSVSANYKTLIDRYFSDVAAASGATSNVYSVETQYYDTTGSIAYSSTFGGSIVDTNAFPADGCNPLYTPGLTNCLSDAQIRTEINSVITAQGWTKTPETQFFMFTPQNVGSCSGGSCAYTQFCAYHGYNSGAPFANQPYAAHAGCDTGEHPNGDDADPTINVVSHEHREAINDPQLNAWWNSNTGQEGSDQCAWNFGASQGPPGSRYNQTINGHNYYLQQEWSNDGVTCLLQYAGSPTAPTVTSFSPTSGPAGTGVTITGTGFTGATAVKFNVTNASYTFNSDTQITATVPSGATTGKISVTTPGGTGTSATNFTVTGGGGGPTITSFTPTSGPVGKIVTINGTGFTGATAVKFNGTSAATWFLSSATKILARVPTGATTGPISVTKPSGTGTSATNFTVTGGGGGGGGGPTITSFTPTSGPVGVIVTINGTGFTGATAVKFNGKPITQGVVNSATKITAVVPTGATTGPISVTTPSGTGTSASNFTVG